MAAPQPPARGEVEVEAEDGRAPNDHSGDAQPPVYSAFPTREKKWMVLAAGAGAFFSPLSATIYIPALNTFANALHVSDAEINLTITVYSIFQAVAPPFVAAYSDAQGRRPAYVLCFIFYIGCSIGLALQNSYAALMVLRALQSATISGTVSITLASVADLVTSAERGSYTAYTSAPSILGPALSPVLGGLLSQFLGWRWIFWFLVILAVIFVTPVALLLPETCREIVGDGSIPPQRWNQTMTRVLRERRSEKAGVSIDHSVRDEKSRERKLRFPNPFWSLAIIFTRPGGIMLSSIGILYACFYVISSSLPSQFQAIYGFNNLEISLMYLPVGLGSLLSTVTTGRLLDWSYRRHARRLGLPVDKTRQADLADFPIERARLEVSLPVFFLGALSVIAYGWCVEAHTHVAGPVILMVVIGYSLIAAFNAIGALLTEIYADRPASASAANNLVRCSLAAVASAVVIPMIEAVGMGWTCTISAGIWILFSPLLVVLMHYGPRWRETKRVAGTATRAETEKAAGSAA